MNVEIVVVGELDTNCYILTKSGHALIIDPGDEYDKIISNVGDNKIDGVLITHSHFDHIGAKEKFDKNIIYDYYNLKEGLTTIGKFTFEVIYTKGHKEDLISFYFDEYKYLFCGDFIFYESIGRTDLEGGNIVDMYNSLKKTIRFSDDVIIYPGHGKPTSFAHERKYSIYFKNMLYRNK